MKSGQAILFLGASKVILLPKHVQVSSVIPAKAGIQFPPQAE
jgi:hypothetical protein